MERRNLEEITESELQDSDMAAIFGWTEEDRKLSAEIGAKVTAELLMTKGYRISHGVKELAMADIPESLKIKTAFEIQKVSSQLVSAIKKTLERME